MTSPDPPPAAPTRPERRSVHLTIGAFSRASRLSQKALRLYGELGLLPPVRVDAGTGYRYYSRAQLHQAHLIARLRDLGLPLGEVRAVLNTPPPERAALLERLWAAYEHEQQRRSALARHLVDHSLTETLHRAGRSPMTTPTTPVLTRHVPDQPFISLTAHTHVQALSGHIESMLARLQAVLAEAGLEPGGPMQILFHGEVNSDSDGPIEVCLPCPEGLKVPADVTRRTEPAHEEAYVTLTKAQFDFPAILDAYAVTGQRAAELGSCGPLSPREIYTHDWHRALPEQIVGDVATPYTPR